MGASRASKPASKAAIAGDVWGEMLAFFFSHQEIPAAAQAFDLTPGHAKALLSLEPGVERPMGELAQTWCCDASNVTWLVDRLEDKGLVERRTPPDDRRVKNVVLTELGEKTQRELVEHLRRPPPDLLALDRAELERLRDAVAGLPPSPGPWSPPPA